MKLSKFIPNQNLVSEIAIPPDLIISVAGSLASHVGRTIGGVYQWLKFLKQYDADFKKIQKDDPEAFAALRSVTSTYGDELKDLIDRYEDRLEAARRPNPNKSIRKADITKFNNAKSDIEKFLSGKIKNDKNVKTILRWIEENMPVDQLRIEGKLYESESNPHQYGAGTRLSSAYTAGKDGKECPVYYRDKTSQGYKAWKRGHDEYKKSKKNEAARLTEAAPKSDMQKLRALIKRDGLQMDSPEQNALRAKIDAKNSKRFSDRESSKSASWNNGPEWGKQNEGLPPAKVRRLKLYKHGPAPETVALAPIGEAVDPVAIVNAVSRVIWADPGLLALTFAMAAVAGNSIGNFLTAAKYTIQNKSALLKQKKESPEAWEKLQSMMKDKGIDKLSGLIDQLDYAKNTRYGDDLEKKTASITKEIERILKSNMSPSAAKTALKWITDGSPLDEDYTMPNLRNYETSPSPYRRSPENGFEKNIPEPDKEDAKVNGGETKTGDIIKKNEKRNRNRR